MIEWCSGDNSVIGQESPESANCDKKRITEKQDATSAGGRQFTEAALAGSNEICDPKKKLRTIILSASPCTGGSPWQFLNIQKTRRVSKDPRAHSKTQKNLQQLRTDHCRNGQRRFHCPGVAIKLRSLEKQRNNSIHRDTNSKRLSFMGAC